MKLTRLDKERRMPSSRMTSMMISYSRRKFIKLKYIDPDPLKLLKERLRIRNCHLPSLQELKTLKSTSCLAVTKAKKIKKRINLLILPTKRVISKPLSLKRKWKKNLRFRILQKKRLKLKKHRDLQQHLICSIRKEN